MTSKTKEIIIEHPLEEVFGLEHGTTITTRTEKSSDLAVVEEYDDKDSEIEEQFEEIYNCAISSYEDLSAEVELAEGKYKARMAEVANQSLSTALSAAKEKANLKQHKDKTDIAKNKQAKQTVNNTLIVADRNELLKTIMDSTKDKK